MFVIFLIFLSNIYYLWVLARYTVYFAADNKYIRSPLPAKNYGPSVTDGSGKRLLGWVFLLPEEEAGGEVMNSAVYTGVSSAPVAPDTISQ